MIYARSDLQRFNKKPRFCSFCRKRINDPGTAEEVKTRVFGYEYFHTACIYAVKNVRCKNGTVITL